jgi:hypothetical protein
VSAANQAPPAAPVELPDLFRAINDRIRELIGRHPVGVADLVCECPLENCTQVLRMWVEEYDAVRARPGFHAVVPGHELQARGEVVGRTDRYVLVRTPAANAEQGGAP